MKHFCILPWINIHMMPNGNIYPCCLTPFTQSLGNTATNSIAEVWNGEELKKMRLELLQDKSPKQCINCKKVDDAGGQSMRKTMNNIFADQFKRKEQTKPDGSLQALPPLVIDMRFSNLCNFRCRTCGPEYSNSWFEESQLFPELFGHPEKAMYRNLDLNSPIWQEIEQLAPSLVEISFAGGEPLIMEEHYKMLDLLHRSNNSDVRLNYVTNLSTLNYKGISVFDYWKQFKNLVIGISLDGLGAKGEYIRKGQDWEKTLENISLLKSNLPHAKFYVVHTLNIMNVLHTPDVISFILKNNIVRAKQIQLNPLITPEHLCIKNLSTDSKKEVHALYKKHILINFDKDPVTAQNLKAVLNFIDESGDTTKLKEFKRITQKLDETRHESFESVFPEVAKLLHYTSL